MRLTNFNKFNKMHIIQLKCKRLRKVFDGETRGRTQKYVL